MGNCSLNSPGCYELAGLGRREHPAEQGRQEFGKPEPKLKRQADVTGAEIGRQRHQHSDLFLSQQRIPPRVGMSGRIVVLPDSRQSGSWAAGKDSSRVDRERHSWLRTRMPHWPMRVLLHMGQ